MKHIDCSVDEGMECCEVNDDFILVKPSNEYIDEIRNFRQEFIDRNEFLHGDTGLSNCENPQDWIDKCRLMEHKETLPYPEWAESTQYMLIRKGERKIFGIIDLRHYLTDYLKRTYGHIGYCVRPTERRKGYAKEMLLLCLEKCRERGLQKVLISCDENNEASRRTILSCGGVFESTAMDDGVTLQRHWITLREIKMIVTDLDGTLLRTDKTISNYTASIFQRCKENGIKIVFATARPIRAVENWLNLPLLFDAGIYHNGAVAKVDGMEIIKCGISPESTKDIILSALQADVSAKLCVEIDDKLYGNYNPSDIWPGIEINITDFSDLPTIPADKILLPMVTMEELNAVAESLPSDLYIEMSENTVGMIMNKDTTKTKAIEFLSTHSALSLSDIVAFGDDHNDVGMLRACGIGVAVANAIDEVKAAANDICDINDNDGVAKWLEENVL